MAWLFKKIMTSSVPLPPLPPGTQPLSNQVAGHKYGQGKTKLGCLQHSDGTILKPVQSPPRGERELEFYSTVFDKDCKDPILVELRNYIPKFHDVVHCETNPDVRYLKLDNMLHKMKRPCIVDIKMGKITYDPDATPEKIAVEVAKFPPVINLGYQLSGMEVFYPEKEQLVKFDKYYCKKLFEDTMIKDGLGKFFLIDEGLRKDIIKVAVQKLKKVEQWFLKQRLFAFYASSILMVYEGETTQNNAQPGLVLNNCSDSNVNSNSSNDSESMLHKGDALEDHSHSKLTEENKIENLKNISSCTDEKNDCETCRPGKHSCDQRMETDTGKVEHEPRLEICMIDFTHVFHSEERDDNYIFGLQNLIKHLQVLLDS